MATIFVEGLGNIEIQGEVPTKEEQQTIMDALDISGKINYIEIPDSIKGKFQNMTNANMSKLRSVGYKDDFNNLDTGIRKYINEIQ